MMGFIQEKSPDDCDIDEDYENEIEHLKSQLAEKEKELQKMKDCDWVKETFKLRVELAELKEKSVSKEEIIKELDKFFDAINKPDTNNKVSIPTLILHLKLLKGTLSKQEKK